MACVNRARLGRGKPEEVTLSELGVKLSELREEPSGRLALLSVVKFLKTLSTCPGLLCVASLGCHSPTLDPGVWKIWLSPLLARVTLSLRGLTYAVVVPLPACSQGFSFIFNISTGPGRRGKACKRKVCFGKSWWSFGHLGRTVATVCFLQLLSGVSGPPSCPHLGYLACFPLSPIS